MNIYQSLYDLIATYIFGGVQMTPNMDLVAIMIATIGCVFLVSLPFTLVYKVVCMISG